MSAVAARRPHPDLYRQLRLLFVLVREGYPELGLPGLGSFLFSGRSTPDLDNLELANQHLLTALRALSFAVEGRVRRPVDYRNLDSEELGSIYESLLELHPEVNLGAATFALNQGAGSERKTTGSHYTPTPLVESLLDTALEPVVADRLAKAEEQWRKGGDRNPDKLRELQEKAILSIKVLDAATGSGHMLIGGGRRLARHLARIRTGDDEPSPEALRHAMRDVVRHCLYGVDLNDMAVELCKVALWMESMEPGKPLSFLDAHIQCGNSLIGVTPGLDISEIPDDAFQPVTGDDKTTATGLRKRNKKEREGQMALQFGDAERLVRPNGTRANGRRWWRPSKTWPRMQWGRWRRRSDPTPSISSPPSTSGRAGRPTRGPRPSSGRFLPAMQVTWLRRRRKCCAPCGQASSSSMKSCCARCDGLPSSTGSFTGHCSSQRYSIGRTVGLMSS